MLECPECGKTFADTYGPDGGRRKRFLHMYSEHGDMRGLPFNKLL